MNGTDPNKFRATLARGPLVENICQIQRVLIYLGGRPGDNHSIEVAEHSLREIAAYTAEPYGHIPPYAVAPDLRRPEPVKKFDATKMAEQFRETGRNLAASLTQMRDSLRTAREAREAALSPEERDARSQSRYDLAVAVERRKGKRYVDGLFAAKRKELGL